ncbi:MAG: HEAT repeat domain-containing protein [Actinomycetota bacterium]|nr:HEAT repeat domain-containing protein [Actinomycetota bacterium]MDD5666163.1 HEAT repeat domain-containing protein [Actinomycetota bacterium]
MPRFGPGKRDISKLERERDTEGIIPFLYDDDENVVFNAIEALTRLGEPRGIEAMMALVADAATGDLIRAKAWLALDVGIEREAKKRTDWK